MDTSQTKHPDWDELFEIAAAQEGLFTTAQAAEAGYSSQLLSHYLSAGRIIRIRRGIYRLVHFPAGEYEELTVTWLWSEQAGVFSHQTALWLHDLSDVLPSRVHLTVPSNWKSRRLRVPEGVVLHYADLERAEQSWFGAIPATNPARTLRDCVDVNLSPEQLRQAALEALDRGLVIENQVAVVEDALQSFGGL